jgi:hypothetical protein
MGIPGNSRDTLLNSEISVVSREFSREFGIRPFENSKNIRHLDRNG